MSLKPNKHLGQHFITSTTITDRIVSAAGIIHNTHILEIGAGPGQLTESIVKARPKSLTIVEKDTRFSYSHISTEVPLQVIFNDALKLNLDVIRSYPMAVIANLPYNISTPLLLHWLPNIADFKLLTLMFQKEVADRILAKPGCKSYGTLSILIQMFCDVKEVAEFGPEIFLPPPQVMSKVINIKPLPLPRYPVNLLTLQKILVPMFAQRRKMIRTGLRSVFKNPITVLESIGIDGTKRPENLNLEEFSLLALANEMRNND